MTDIRWDLIQPVDVGERIQQGYQLAQRNALMQQEQGYQQQERAYQQAQRQQAQTAQITEQQREAIRIGSRLVRQINPQDQPGWERTLAAARQLGVPLDGVPSTFDPNYVQQLVAAGQAMETPQQQEPTAFQRDDRYIRQTYGDEAGDQYVQRHIAPPPITRQNADGTITIIPQAGPPLRRQQQQAPQQPVTMTPAQLRAAADQAIQNGAPREAVEAELQRMLSGGAPDTRPANDPAPAFHPAPGGAAPGQRPFP